MRLPSLDSRGAAAVEFAFALPVFALLAVGAIQLGMLAFARSGLHQAVDEGARYATIYPAPSDSQIVARVQAQEFGLDPAYTGQPTVTHGTQYGTSYTEITMTYTPQLNFVFFQTAPTTLSYTRRAY